MRSTQSVKIPSLFYFWKYCFINTTVVNNFMLMFLYRTLGHIHFKPAQKSRVFKSNVFFLRIFSLCRLSSSSKIQLCTILCLICHIHIANNEGTANTSKLKPFLLLSWGWGNTLGLIQVYILFQTLALVEFWWFSQLHPKSYMTERLHNNQTW
jgi:hypothetical protein